MAKEKPEKEKSNVDFKVIKKAGCEIEVELKASSNILKKAKKEALKELKKEISIPGFRKGKAPDEMISQKYPEALQEKLQKKIADLSFIEAHKSEKLPPISTNSKITFNVKDLKENEAEIIFSYETDPELPVIDPTKFKLKEIKKHSVGKKEIEEAIRQVRFFYAKFKEITDRPVKKGDYLIIDLYSIDGDTESKAFSDTRFEITDTSMAKWMQDLVIGANTGDSIEGISKPDDNATEEEKKAFSEKKVRIHIKLIEEVDLPEINDDFAKMVGSQNVEEMEKSIKNMLKAQVDEKYEKDKREQVNIFLVDTYKFELPSTLLKTEIQSRTENLFKDPSFKQKYDKMSKSEKASFEESIQKQADEAIRIFYLTRKIITDNNIQITDDEIKKTALQIIIKSSPQVTPPDHQNIPKDTLAFALSRLVLHKAQDYILEQSKKS